jgi:hypothetical protein
MDHGVLVWMEPAWRQRSIGGRSLQRDGIGRRVAEGIQGFAVRIGFPQRKVWSRFGGVFAPYGPRESCVTTEREDRDNLATDSVEISEERPAG